MTGGPHPAPWPAVHPTRTMIMDRRRFLVGSLGGLAAVALSSCHGRSQAPLAQGPRPTVRLPQGALGFPSPFAANGAPGYGQMSLLYDTLVWKDGGGQLLPWLAEHVDTSPDHLVYTFNLRDGVTWSDGRPLTADDVAFTFDYYARQKTLPPPVLVQPPDGIAKVRTEGAKTVEITVTTPMVTFPEQVAGALPILPRHVWSSIGDPASAQDRKLLVGTGPYKLTSYTGDGDPLLYAAKDDYFLGAPFVKRIEEEALDDEFSALLSGAADVARGVGLRSDTLAPFQGNAGFGMVTEQGSTGSVLYWNMAKEGALSDVRFRRACAMAIDRQELVTRLAAGRGLPGNPGFLGPENRFYTPVRQYELDVAGANALLDAAGYRAASGGGPRRGPDGSPLSFELLIDDTQAPLAEILVEALKRIAVELRTKPVQIGPQLFGNKLLGVYDMAVLFFPGPAPGGPNADPDVLRQLFSSTVPPSLLGASNYANRSFDALAATQRASFDEAERKAVVAQMQTLLADDLPVLALYYPETALVFRKAVLDQWYFTPGQFPTSEDNKQLFVTGQKTGTTIRSAR